MGVVYLFFFSFFVLFTQTQLQLENPFSNFLFIFVPFIENRENFFSRLF